MKGFESTDIEGVFVIDLFHSEDDRGVFVKTLHRSTLLQHGLVGDFRESFYSTNKKGVIRGMHFQYPPYDHAKIVYCTSGSLTDVVLDLRIGSPTYGNTVNIKLTHDNYKAVYMPSGVAHGFEVHEDQTTMIYLTQSEHHPPADGGIRYDSFQYPWSYKAPILSDRDKAFPTFGDFQSPFLI